MKNKLYTSRQAAEYLGRSVKGIHLLVKNKHLIPLPRPEPLIPGHQPPFLFSQKTLDNFDPPKMGHNNQGKMGRKAKMVAYIESLPADTEVTPAIIHKLVNYEVSKNYVLIVLKSLVDKKVLRVSGTNNNNMRRYKV